ncbi:MAG: 16S rRNA (cytidine(1402)-2'-O)-methyltransferase [Desulfovibrionaceae bacterium]|nr:16S rRNA (cytidine(1402)-2'-O)-methyltransferase [Desulfovibrionaceae bacterium]
MSLDARLFVVATPLGNVDDLAPRARKILSTVDYILCEDTRRSQRLLAALGISGQKLISYHDHNEAVRIPWVLEKLSLGHNIALISDAGTPLVADPGYRLVRACRKAKLLVSPVPGPSAPVAALACAGLPPIPYTFLGFLPRDEAAKVKLFQTFAAMPCTLVFFERSDRLQASLSIASSILGPRELAICRELTKIYEEFKLLRLEEYASLDSQILGEITVLVGPPERSLRASKDSVLAQIRPYVQNQVPARKIVHAVEALVQGWSSKEIYSLITQLKAELSPKESL